MSSPAPSPSTPDAPPADPTAADRAAARALIQRQLTVLTHLTDLGMQIAEAAARRAVTSLNAEPPPPEAEPRHDPALAYARAARAVRMSIALQSRLSKDLLDLDRAAARDHTLAADTRRARAHRLVERAIEAQRDDEDEIETLSEEARENLWDEDEYGPLMSHPLAETVARICRDLGLSPGETAWAGEAWAGEAAAGSIAPEAVSLHLMDRAAGPRTAPLQRPP